MSSNSAYIISGLRSAIGNFKGTLSAVRTDDLLSQVLAALLAQHPNVPWEKTDDVLIGCANQAGEDNRNVARMALLLAGMPVEVPGETINRLCASGMSAVVHAHRAVRAQEGHLFIAGGVEGMSRAPYVLSKAHEAYSTGQEMFDSSFGWRFINPRMEALYGCEGMGQTAENLAERYGISREMQDAFAVQSQQKAFAAQQRGRFSKEITPVLVAQRKSDPLEFSKDEFLKPHTTMEGLARLRAAFKKNGTVTAGNASGLNDGAAALLIASDYAVKDYGLSPLARIVSSGVSGVEPSVMGIGPVQASALALSRAGLSLAQMDIIEINEAFAAQVLACLKEMQISPEDPRLNCNGGAIALGHPLGMSGARILHSAALELSLQNKRYALVTMCIGVGQGYAVVLENPHV